MEFRCTLIYVNKYIEGKCIKLSIVKKLVLTATIASFSLTGTALADAKNYIEITPHNVTIQESSNNLYSDAVSNADNDRAVRIEKVAELSGVDKQTGKISDEALFKKSLLEFFNTDPVKYESSIKNIDSIIANISSNNVKSSGVITPTQVIMEGWSKEPTLRSSTNYVTYTTNWITEDNYRSSVPIKATYTKSLKTTQSLGFNGASEIKSKFGFSASYSVEQSASITQGVDVPAWTVWGTRPYIKFRTDTYQGEYYLTIFNGSYIETVYYDKTGSNNVLLTRSNEYWSRENSSKNTSATTPAPPTGAPNV